MSIAQVSFYELAKLIRTKENYVPRNYQTIGGMWTVDTWKLNDITYQVMDEGYTEKIYTDVVSVIRNYENKLTFEKGNEKLLKATLELLEESK